LLAGWRVANLTGALPAYGDVLEVVWTTIWYDGALRGMHGFLVYPSIFFPVGWHVATFAGGPAMFLLLLPLKWLGGPAFAYNVTTLLTFALAFAGTNRLARRFLGALPAAVAALLFTFWGFRWFRIAGHLNISLASALLPWLALSIDRALDAERRKVVWWALAGALWAAMIACSWYFVWMGGILLCAWVGGRWLADRALGRAAVAGLLISTAVALAISSPWLILFLRESSAVGASFYSIEEVSFWSASLNSLPIPSVTHPWLQGLAHALYTGPVNEPGQANLGLVACLLALVGLRSAWRDRRWWPVLVLAVAGLLLALGLTLKWNGQSVQLDALRPINDLIWQIGHWLKPSFFATARPPEPFTAAVPLPGLLLSVFVPFWERARVFARYGLLLGMGVFLLAGLGLSRLRYGWARALVAGLLLFEVLPAPTQAVPFPPPSHPAFDWLKGQQLDGGAILDLGSWYENLAYMPISGNALWATEYHKQSAVAGASSVWPPHIVFLDRWLSTHPHPFQNPDFIPLLRFYNVRMVVLHVTGGYAEDMLAEARQNPELAGMRCFNPVNDLGPWNYPICVAPLTPPARPAFNLLRQDGWSGAEEWGHWVEGTEARASWAAPMRKSSRLALDIFPICVPGRPQGVTIEVNGKILTTHQWQECEPWQSDMVIPENFIQVGWNDIVLRPAYAARPVDFTGGQNTDSRMLSVGVRRLEIGPAAVQ
jgi:hypothetical protein